MLVSDSVSWPPILKPTHRLYQTTVLGMPRSPGFLFAKRSQAYHRVLIDSSELFVLRNRGNQPPV